MRERHIIQALSDAYGGKVRFERKRNPNHSNTWRWTIGDRKAEAFLNQIKDKLMAKRAQAEIAVHFSQNKPRGGRRSELQRLIQEDCWHEMRRLNQRGVGKWV